MDRQTVYDMLVGVIWILLVTAGLQFLVWYVGWRGARDDHFPPPPR